MRILLDAKDLINAVEHGKPLPLHDFAAYLKGKRAKLVLTLTNVFELAAPLTAGGNVTEVMHLLQKIEQLPVCYLHNAGIQIEELREAIAAFRANREFTLPELYVQRFDDAVAYPGPPATQSFVLYRLDEIVRDIWEHHPEVIRRFKDYAEPLRKQFARDRTAKTNSSARAKNFVSKIRRTLIHGKISFAEDEVKLLAEWILATPTRCPGLRLDYETYHHLVNNRADVPKDSDLADFSYFPAIPYVDACTVDRRMHSYLSQASRFLAEQDQGVDYRDRLYTGLRALMTANP